MSDRDTIERAIRHIDSCLDVDPWARDIAIDAMKAQLSEEGTTKDTTFDLISRQALRLMKAEECAGHTIEYAMGWKACIEWIKTLPSVQPKPEQITTSEQPVLDRFGVKTGKTRTYTISRQAAIDAVENCEPGEELFAIKSLPSVQPERKTGRWYQCGDSSYRCSECESISCCNANYCPDCGAEMKGDSNG